MVKTAALSGKTGGQHSSLLKAMSALTRMGSGKQSTQKHDDRCQLAGLILAQGLTRVSCVVLPIWTPYPTDFRSLTIARPRTSLTILMPDHKIGTTFFDSRSPPHTSAAKCFPTFLRQIGSWRKGTASTMAAYPAREIWRQPEKLAVHPFPRSGKRWPPRSNPPQPSPCRSTATARIRD
jgi:hypothetical protein